MKNTYAQHLVNFKSKYFVFLLQNNFILRLQSSPELKKALEQENTNYQHKTLNPFILIEVAIPQII